MSELFLSVMVFHQKNLYNPNWSADNIIEILPVLQYQ